MGSLILHFQKTGLYTSIQDGGRYGVQHLGIPIGGAMDQEAMRNANYLVGNNPDDPVIEMTIQGAEIKIEGGGQIALAGGYFKGTLNEQPLPFYRTITVKDGDIIRIGNVIFGTRTYLAVRGTIAEEKWLGSHSAVNIYMESFGLESHFPNGRMVEYQTPPPIEKRLIERAKHPIHAECAIVRTTSGPDFEKFPIEVVQEFYEKIFTVSNKYNRMGYKLNEALGSFTSNKESISSGILPGTIQVTNEGKPIILMRDAQTTGGYPRIANVVEEDIDLVAQMKQGNELKFILQGKNDQ